VIDQWVRTKYPPGASALLAIGARHGVAWLVTPIEAMTALVLVWHTTRRLLGPRPALVALVTLGVAPLFGFQAASFYAHTAATMFLAVAFAAVASWTQSKRQGWLVLAGIAIGLTFLTRPLDALLFGLAMVSLRSVRAVVIAAASALPFVAMSFAYQAAQFGSPFTDGYKAYQPTLVELYGRDIAANQVSFVNLVSGQQQWNHIDVFRALIVDWTVPGTALVALFGAWAITRDHRARAMRTFSIALIATFAVALLPTIADLDDGARPRYMSITLIPLAFLTAAGFAPVCEAIAAKFGRRIRTILVVTAVVFGLAQLASFLQDRVPKVWKREGLYQVSADLPYGAVVIVRAQYPSRFARNGPFFDGVLYLSPTAATTALEIAAAYPDRPIWEAHEGVPWTLVRVR
jgi:4-amino-4-deoxy-L-arabinose transferase-like glycosyltransferase